MRISDWSSDVCSSDLPCVTSSAQTAVLRVVPLAPPTEKNAPSLRVVTPFATKESFYSTHSYPGLVSSTPPLSLSTSPPGVRSKTVGKNLYLVICYISSEEDSPKRFVQNTHTLSEASNSFSTKPMNNK